MQGYREANQKRDEIDRFLNHSQDEGDKFVVTRNEIALNHEQ